MDSRPTDGWGERLVGREVPMGAIAQALARVRRGTRQTILLTGEAGIGKSRCLREIESRSNANDLRVRLGRCWEEEGAPPFWPWIQILRQHLGSAGGGRLRTRLGPGSEDLAVLLDPECAAESAPRIARSPAHRFRLFDAAARFFSREAAAEAIVVLLDDLHRADPPSILLLRHLIREAPAARLLLVGTYRDTDVDPKHPLLRVLSEAHSEHLLIRLPGLEHAAIARLVELATGAEPSEELVATLRDRTQGNPLFLVEMLRLLEAEGRLAGAGTADLASIEVPATVGQVVRQRLARLSVETRAVLSVAALVGRAFTTAILDRVCEGAAPCLRWIDEAARARLVIAEPAAPGAFRFAHDLVRQILQDEIALDRRAFLHGSVADAIEAVHADDPTPHLGRLAHHRLEAAPLGDAGPAIDAAERAAHAARRQLAHEEAVRQYESALRALDLLGDASEAPAALRRTRLTIELGEERWAAGDQAGAREAFLAGAEGARRDRDGELLGRAAFGFTGRTDLTLEVDPRAVGLLEEAIAALGHGDGPLLCRLGARLATALYFGPELERSAELARQAVASAEAVDEPEAIAYCLTAQAHVSRRPGHDPLLPIADRIVAISRAAGARDLEALGHYERMLELLELGDVAGADLAIAECARLAHEIREPWFHWWSTGFEAMRALLVGDLVRAEERITQGFELGSSVDTPNTLTLFGGTLYYLRREQGRLPELEGAIRTMARQSPDQPVFQLALALLLLEAGRPEEARALYEPIAARGFATLPPDAMWSASMFLSCDLAIALGDTSAIDPLADALGPHAERCHVVAFGNVWLGSGHLPLGRLSVARGRPDEAIAFYEGALRAHRRAGARPLVARSLAAMAEALRARGHRDDAERASRAALEAAALAREIGLRIPLAESDARAASAPTQSSARVEPRRGRLEHRGDNWEARFAGKTVSIRDSLGLHDLVVLLARPEQEVHVSELARESDGPTPRGASSIDPESLAQGSLRIRRSEAGLEPLDARARTAYRQRLAELRHERAEASEWNDRGRIDRLAAEIEALEAELSASFLAGRARMVASPSLERARKAVAKRIGGAIGRIERHHPELGRHLRLSIRTGSFCRYEPERPTEWEIASRPRPG